MKETTIEPYLPMLERFEEFFREELASRLSAVSYTHLTLPTKA